MAHTLSIKDKRAILRALSALSINLSAAWFGTTIITPNFAGLTKPDVGWILTGNIIFGILCLLITIKLERYLEDL